jgi:hypothetical protein
MRKIVICMMLVVGIQAWAIAPTNPSKGGWDYDSKYPERSSNSEALDVSKTLLEMVSVWNVHNLDKFMTYFWNSPDLTIVDQGWQRMGWKKLHDDYYSFYKDPKKMGIERLERTKIRMLADGVAYAMSWWTEEQSETRHLYEACVLQKINGVWVIIDDSSTLLSSE